MSVTKDFDPITGKLVPVDAVAFTKLDEERGAKKPSFLSNPLALAPTGTPPGKTGLHDLARAAMVLFSSLGGLTAVVQLLQWLNLHPSQLGQYGAQIAAVAGALVYLITARQADNTPRTP